MSELVSRVDIYIVLTFERSERTVTPSNQATINLLTLFDWPLENSGTSVFQWQHKHAAKGGLVEYQNIKAAKWMF